MHASILITLATSCDDLRAALSGRYDLGWLREELGETFGTIWQTTETLTTLLLWKILRRYHVKTRMILNLSRLTHLTDHFKTTFSGPSLTRSSGPYPTTSIMYSQLCFRNIPFFVKATVLPHKQTPLPC